MKNLISVFLTKIKDINKGLSKEEQIELIESERQQYKLRIKVYTILFLFFFWRVLASYPWGPEDYNVLIIFCYIILVLPLSIGPFLLIKHKKIVEASGKRILFGQVLDIVCLTVGFSIDHSDHRYSLLILPVYTMVILGNGVRFGIHFLLSSVVLVLASFVVNISIARDIWLSDINMTIGVLLNFAVLAGYTKSLISRLNKVQKNLVDSQKSKVKVLEEVSELKSRFFANMSHELRTPIAISLASVETLSSGLPEGESDAREKLAMIKRNQKRLLSLVNQILDLEKLEKGELGLKVQKVLNPCHFLENRVRQFLDLAQKKKISLEVSCDSSLRKSEIYFDVDMMDKVVFNLLSNAIKFTKQGQVKLSSRVVNSSWIIEVEDTGVGIREGEIGKVFDRFQQATGSESKDYAGTGLGLSLVKEVVEAHSGQVSVASIYGKGSQFKVEIPVGRQHFSAERVVDQPYGGEEQGIREVEEGVEGEEDVDAEHLLDQWNDEVFRNGTQQKVLFVDDNRDLRKFVADNLSGKYSVLLACNGLHGFSAANKYEPDIIISDQMMPKCSGTEFLKKIRESESLAQVPFVILTANADPESKMESLKLGADDFLYKPFYLEEILLRIENLLTLRDQQVRIQKDLLAAKAIQQSMLPRLGQAQERYMLDAFYRPCDQLSGDFFDCFDFEQHTVFYLADVTSHGVASAQVTYVVRSIFKSLLEDYKGDLGADDLVELFSRDYKQHPLEYGVALQVFKFDKRSLQLECAHSGAPPAILFRETDFELLAPRPASFIHRNIQEKEFSKGECLKYDLRKGDVLLCLTDGVTEIVSAKGSQVSITRLAKDLEPLIRKESWKENTFDRLVQIQGHRNFMDDLSMIRLEIF